MQDWINVKDIELKEGDKYICWFKGEPIILGLGYETSTYYENFKPYFYWHEPSSDMLDIEWHEVEWVIPAPLSPECYKTVEPKEPNRISAIGGGRGIGKTIFE